MGSYGEALREDGRGDKKDEKQTRDRTAIFPHRGKGTTGVEDFPKQVRTEPR